MLKPSFRFDAIGTSFEIITPAPLPVKVRDEIMTICEAFDATFSRFREDSLIARIALSGGTFAIPENATKLFELYETLNQLSEGKVNPLVGDSLNALGYDAQYSFHVAQAKPAPEFQRTVRREADVLIVDRPVTIDIGAAGKGYLVDEIARLLDENEQTEYLIDGSGDMVHKGSQPLRIGLEDPRNEGRVIGEIALSNQALCASAINRRAWGEGMHHVIDPSTGEPNEGVIATWVVADSCMQADGLATALFFCAPQKLKEKYNYEYMKVMADGTIAFSSHFNKSLYGET